MKNEPVPIVASAAVEVLEGVKKYAEEVSAQFRIQQKKQAEYDAAGLELGRLVCELAARPDLQARLAVINRGKNGRPEAPHCFAARQLVAAGATVSEKHIIRMARGFLNAQKKGLPITTSIRTVEAMDLVKKYTDKSPDDVMPSIERLFDTDASQGSDGEGDSFDAERDALRVARKIREFLYTPEGHPRLRTRKQKDEFAQNVNKALSEQGLDWELVPQERK
jgi:hypothetical protein